MTDITSLRHYLASNRFMPVPPPELTFCGDGDFRAIGAEFLEWVVREAGLKCHERVLDIGCGIGRLALPMTQFLNDAGSYDGVDPVAAGIDWCEQTITPLYPSVRFRHLDVRHPLYNLEGRLETAKTPLPFADESFDVVCMISVLTHLDLPEVLHYAAEAARLLAPGGRCFVTAFLMNAPARAALAAGGGRIAFDPAGEGPTHYSNLDAPLAGVAFDEDALLERFLRHDLRRIPPARYGCWSGRILPNFQDICVFERG